MEFLINHLWALLPLLLLMFLLIFLCFSRETTHTANNQFSLARRMCFILIRKRNAHGSQPAWRRSTWASSTTAHGICTASSAWRAPRRSSTRRLLPVWHSHRPHRSLDSGAMCAPIPFMDWASPPRRSWQRYQYPTYISFLISRSN